MTATELRSATPDEFHWFLAYQVAAFDRFGAGEVLRVARRRRPDDRRFSVIVQADPTSPIPESLVRSWTYFRDNEAKLCEMVLGAILSKYQLERPELVDAYDPDFVDQDVPEISSVNGLTPVLAFHTLYIHPADRGSADLGFEFACTWDPEHGVGVRVRGGRVVCVGGASDAIEG